MAAIPAPHSPPPVETPPHAPPPPSHAAPAEESGSPGVGFAVDLAPRAPRHDAKAGHPAAPVLPANATTEQTENPRLHAFFAPFARIDEHALDLVVGIPMIIVCVLIFWSSFRSADLQIKRRIRQKPPAPPKKSRWT